jgi:hypothetical protein
MLTFNFLVIIVVPLIAKVPDIPTFNIVTVVTVLLPFNLEVTIHLYVLLTHCCTCFVWISEQTAIIFLYTTNLVFITETECDYELNL